MRYKIDTKYVKKHNETVYTIWYGPRLNKCKTVSKKGNMLQLDKLSAHERFLCELREETKNG